MIEDRFEEISALFKKSYIDEFWLAQKPWLSDPSHRYKAYIRFFVERPGKNKLYRQWSWIEAFGPTGRDAMDTLTIKIHARLLDIPRFVLQEGVIDG